MKTIPSGTAPAPDDGELEIVPDVARTGRRRQVTVCFAYTCVTTVPSHRLKARRSTPQFTVDVMHRGQGPRHSRPATTWPTVTSETLGSRRRFRRALVAAGVTTAAISVLLLVLFGVGGDVITQVATALVAHVGGPGN